MAFSGSSLGLQNSEDHVEWYRFQRSVGLNNLTELEKRKLEALNDSLYRLYPLVRLKINPRTSWRNFYAVPGPRRETQNIERSPNGRRIPKEP